VPLSVAQEHLSPLLSVREAAGLRVVNKALKASVREWPVHLGNEPELKNVGPEDLGRR
jgi:hypothetical protein